MSEALAAGFGLTVSMFYPTMTLRPAVKAHGTMGETMAVFEEHHDAHQETVGMI